MILDDDPTEEHEAFPRTRDECREQGRRDFLAGYPSTWTPNLGPLTANPDAWAWWYEGWTIEARRGVCDGIDA